MRPSGLGLQLRSFLCGLLAAAMLYQIMKMNSFHPDTAAGPSVEQRPCVCDCDSSEKVSETARPSFEEVKLPEPIVKVDQANACQLCLDAYLSIPTAYTHNTQFMLAQLQQSWDAWDCDEVLPNRKLRTNAGSSRALRPVIANQKPEAESTAIVSESKPRRHGTNQLTSNAQQSATKCDGWVKQYGINPGLSWGSFPERLHAAWRSLHCDALAGRARDAGPSANGSALHHQVKSAARVVRRQSQMKRSPQSEVCLSLARTFAPLVGSSWGLLPKDLRRKWTKNNCDVHGRHLEGDCRAMWKETNRTGQFTTSFHEYCGNYANVFLGERCHAIYASFYGRACVSKPAAMEKKLKELHCGVSKSGVDVQFPIAKEVADCTMESCFDHNRCGKVTSEQLQVYIYGTPATAEFRQYHDALAKVPFVEIVSDPADACLLLPTANTDCIVKTGEAGDTQQCAEGLVRREGRKIWDGGTNHVILDHQNSAGLAYAPGRAIVVKSGLTPERYRPGFDVVLALANNRPDLDAMMQKTTVRRPEVRTTLLGFQGSATIKKRCDLYKLHNGKDIQIMVTKWESVRCNHYPKGQSDSMTKKEKDNYFNFLTDTVFGIVAPGHGLHSWRLVETMLAGAIPVVIGPVMLPLCDVIDWSKFIVHVPDWNDIEKIPAMLAKISLGKRAEMQALAIETHGKYFSSVDRHMFGVWGILRDRIIANRQR